MRGPCPGPLSLLTSAGRNPHRPRRSQGPALPDSAACHPRKASGRLGDCTSSSATRVTPCPSPAVSNPGLLFSSPAPGGEQRPWGWRCSWPGGLGAPALSRRCPQPSPQFGVRGCAGVLTRDVLPSGPESVPAGPRWQLTTLTPHSPWLQQDGPDGRGIRQRIPLPMAHPRVSADPRCKLLCQGTRGGMLGVHIKEGLL